MFEFESGDRTTEEILAEVERRKKRLAESFAVQEKYARLWGRYDQLKATRLRVVIVFTGSMLIAIGRLALIPMGGLPQAPGHDGVAMFFFAIGALAFARTLFVSNALQKVRLEIHVKGHGQGGEMDTKTIEKRALSRKRDLWFMGVVASVVTTALLMAEASAKVGQELLPFRVGWPVVAGFAAAALVCIWKVSRLTSTRANEVNQPWPWP